MHGKQLLVAGSFWTRRLCLDMCVIIRIGWTEFRMRITDYIASLDSLWRKNIFQRRPALKPALGYIHLVSRRRDF